MSSPIENWTLDGIKNPLALQSILLDEFENASGGKYTIADGNNVVAFLMNAFSTITSGIVRKIDDTVLPAIYPSRAVTISDIYKHLSDYDYLGLFASPAASEVILIVDKGYLMRHAVPVYAEKDGETIETHREVVIPKSARFKMGSKTFGLYYPIKIKVSNSTGMFTVEYDSSVKNPLHTLNENVLTCQFFRNDGVVLAYIHIPVYQFDTMVVEEPLVSGSGYKKSITFSDQFYAVKCYADVKSVVENADGSTEEVWTNQELALSLSGRSYDPSTPTVVFDVDPESRTLNLNIPYVYFTNEQIRGRFRVEVYTTAGYLNYNIPTNTEELVGLDFFSIALDSETARYAEPFRTMPSLAAVPASMVVTGGTNGMSFSEVRRRILTSSFTDKTLQTPADVDAYFANVGYTTSLYKDGITDRVFIAHSVLRDENNDIIGAAAIDTLIDKAAFEKDNTSTIVKVGTDTYTILPSTRYKFDKEAGICRPITDAELDNLKALDAASKVVEFNNNTYTLCPFHIQCNVSDKYPSTCTFDLTDCAVESREFLFSRNTQGDSGTGDKQLSLYTASLITAAAETFYTSNSSNKTTDTYNLILRLTKSGLDNVAYDRFGVYVGLKTVDGSFIWTFARPTSGNVVGDSIYLSLGIAVTAAFTQVDGQYAVRVQSPFSKNGVNVYLTCEARVVCCVQDYDVARANGTSITGGTNISGIAVSGETPIVGRDGFVAFTEHRLTLRFGRQINELDQRIALSYAGNNYKTYNTTEMATLPTPKYKTDESGVPILVYKDGSVVGVEEEYPAGTMVGFTNFLPGGEVVFAHSLLRSNRLGCTYMLEGDDTEYTYGDGDDPADGTKITLMGRVTPRFKINDTMKIAGSASDAVGAYELADASRIGGLSKHSDIWYKVDVVHHDGEPDETTVHSVKSVDALDAIYKYCCTKLVGTSIQNVTGLPNGSFVLINDDRTEINDEEEQAILNKIKIADLRTGDSATRTRLYQYVDGKWVCLLIVNEESELSAYLSEHSNVDKVHGYAYIITKETDVNATPSYVAFINKTEDGAVDITPRNLFEPVYKLTEDETMVDDKKYFIKTDDGFIEQIGLEEFAEGVNYYEDTGEKVAVDQWANIANKWPWDVSEWSVLSTVEITYKNAADTEIASEFITCAQDTYFDIAFDSGRMYKYVAHLSTHPVLDENGQPMLDEDNPREVKFMINMLHLDAKLAVATSSVSKVYPDNIVEVMRTHFNNLGSVKNRLYTNTRLYFEPIKSLGYGKFYTDGDTIKTLPLDVTMKFRLHVSADIADDEDLREAMKNSIITLIDNHMAKGSTNMTVLAQEIRDNNSDSVKYVDVLGIDGDTSLQTMRAVDESIKPHLKHVLTLLDDHTTIDVTRGLELEFVVADV